MKIAAVLSGSNNVVDRLLKFLDAQPDDEIFTMRELEEKLQCSIRDTGTFKRNQWRCPEYTRSMVVNGQRKSVWGSKAAILNLEAQTHED